MDCDMQKKVTIFSNNFTPGREGVSNQIDLLLTHLARNSDLKITLHDISHTFRFNCSSSHISYGLPFLPFGILLTKLIEKRSDLIHIFGSLTGRLYLRMLKKQPILLTNSSAIRESRVKECSKHWTKIDKIIVECRRDEDRVIEYGIERDRVSLLYPGLDLDAFSYTPPADGFRIGFASSPISSDKQGINARGVELLVSAARQLKDVEFLLLWREKHYSTIQSLLTKSPPPNLSVINKILPDMNAFYGTVHCTILPSTSMDDCKPCPNSLMESLSAGKPVLVSDRVGISDIVNDAGCGLVFQADMDDIIAKIHEMQDRYSIYQSKARQTAEKYFSVDSFVTEYTKMYNTLVVS